MKKKKDFLPFLIKVKKFSSNYYTHAMWNFAQLYILFTNVFDVLVLN
jgi:hypothetical protein